MYISAKTAQLSLNGWNINLSDCIFSLDPNNTHDPSSEFQSQLNSMMRNVPQSTKQKEALASEEELQEGAMVFNSLCNTWAENFDKLIKDPFADDVGDQPDRGEVLKATLSHHSRVVFVFIRHSGGLTHAVLQCLTAPTENSESIEFQNLARLIAENMAQVASLLCPPLADLLEYPWRIE